MCSLNENFSFLSLMEKTILACFAQMMALAVHRNGHPKIIGALSSPPVSTTTKSIGTYDYPTRMTASSRTPSR
jgi:hypothetical protein